MVILNTDPPFGASATLCRRVSTPTSSVIVTAPGGENTTSLLKFNYTSNLQLKDCYFEF